MAFGGVALAVHPSEEIDLDHHALRATANYRPI
jgi:hypothetical protein